MIIPLDDAREINPEITQLELDAYESQIRALTNNNFNHKYIKVLNIGLTGNKIITPIELLGIKAGHTVEIFGTVFNNGLYVVTEVKPFELIVEADFTSEIAIRGGVVLVDYPSDLQVGLAQVIAYKHKMANKIGIKSESVARMSTTYVDANNVEGVPNSQWAFLDKYKKIRW